MSSLFIVLGPRRFHTEKSYLVPRTCEVLNYLAGEEPHWVIRPMQEACGLLLFWTATNATRSFTWGNLKGPSAASTNSRGSVIGGSTTASAPTTKRVFNFNAGPAALPLPVLERIREELLDWRGSGMSVIEMSHRSPEFG